MKKEILNKIVEIVESLNWNIDINGNEFNLQKFSPAGQDFNFSITSEDLEEFINNLEEYYEDFDVSYETYLWLDNSGHGTNGAPYDMKDLYEDMKACESMVFEILEEIKKLEGEYIVFELLEKTKKLDM